MNSMDYVIDGFCFQNQKEFFRAKKEREAIEKIKVGADIFDPKIALKLYNRAVDKSSFQTIFGHEFMRELRAVIIKSNIITEETLNPIPVLNDQELYLGVDEKAYKKYKILYEKHKENGKILKTIIGCLIVLMVGLIVVSYKTKYSAFTYFTDYKASIENEVIDKYQEWEKELEQREQSLKDKGL